MKIQITTGSIEDIIALRKGSVGADPLLERYLEVVRPHEKYEVVALARCVQARDFDFEKHLEDAMYDVNENDLTGYLMEITDLDKVLGDAVWRTLRSFELTASKQVAAANS